MWEYMDTNELYHYGRLGMKWGVRLYQNSDGSLTALGKQRYGTKENFGRVVAAKQKAADYKKNKKAYELQAKKNAKADEQIKEIKRKAGMKVKDDSNNGENRIKTNDSQQENSTKPKKKISEMSNREIQEQINRIQLERQLKREMAAVRAEQASQGKKVVKKLLNIYGDQAIQEAFVKPISKQIGKKITEAMNDNGQISKSEKLKQQQKDAENEFKISEARKKTIINNQKIEEMRRDPNYKLAFDKTDRKEVRRDDKRNQREEERRKRGG